VACLKTILFFLTLVPFMRFCDEFVETKDIKKRVKDN
jgi:hypothetical protein